MKHKLMKIALSSMTIIVLFTSCISSTPKNSERTSNAATTLSPQTSLADGQTTAANNISQEQNNIPSTTAAQTSTSPVNTTASSSVEITQSSANIDTEKQNLLSQLQMNISQTNSTTAGAINSTQNSQSTQSNQNSQITQSTTAVENNQLIQPTQPSQSSAPVTAQIPNATVDSGMGYIEQKNFGSYMIPTGWSEWSYHSTDSKWFYTKGTPANDAICTNISIQCYTNSYTKEGYEDFLKDLVVFYKQQLSQEEYDSMKMEGISSTKGYPIVKVAINNTDGRKTIQYYIIGDYKHVLVHLTDFNDTITDGDTSALYIVDSFQWTN